jgi:hypothetical protein
MPLHSDNHRLVNYANIYYHPGEILQVGQLTMLEEAYAIREKYISGGEDLCSQKVTHM